MPLTFKIHSNFEIRYNENTWFNKNKVFFYDIIILVIVMKKTINISLKEPCDYKNKYNEKILSYQLSNYILEELKGIDTKQTIEFDISTKFEINEKEKNNLVDMIRNNFGADISEIMNIAKKQRMIHYLIFIISIVLISISSVIPVKLLAQFILILGWVLLGESICNFLYKGMETNHKIARRKQIVNAKVIFK